MAPQQHRVNTNLAPRTQKLMYAHNGFAPLHRGGGVCGGSWVSGGSRTARARVKVFLALGLDRSNDARFPLDTRTDCCTLLYMERNDNRRRQDVGAKIEAIVLVAVVLLTGYLVGMVATDSVRAWLEAMPV